MMDDLNDLPLYSVAQCRGIDKFAIEELGIAGIVLMKRAAAASVRRILQQWPEVSRVQVLCGTGNNAGDGFLIAAQLTQSGREAEILLMADPGCLQGDARRAYDFARELQVPQRRFQPDIELDADVLVDALLGTGLNRPVQPDYAAAIAALNAATAPVLAIDLPSGLNADTGAEMGSCVQAQQTVSFVAPKRGLYTGAGRQSCGQIFFDRLEIPEQAYAQYSPVARLLDFEAARRALPQRQQDSHKATFGHVLVLGGNHGMGGAALLSAEAALLCGSGLVTVGTRAEHVAGMLARRPELMVKAVSSYSQCAELLNSASVIVVGPGLGTDAWAQHLLRCVLDKVAEQIVLLDADALNLIATHGLSKDLQRIRTVITPHPGEAARLLNVSTADIAADRFSAARDLVHLTDARVVLKGAGSLVASAAGMAVCPYGNPLLSSAGTGDVLSGVCAALLGQMSDPGTATELAVCAHAKAADELALRLARAGVAAAELAPAVRRLLFAAGAA